MDVFFLLLLHARSLSFDRSLSCISARSPVNLVDLKCYLKYAAYEHRSMCRKLSAHSWTIHTNKILDLHFQTTEIWYVSVRVYAMQFSSDLEANILSGNDIFTLSYRASRKFCILFNAITVEARKRKSLLFSTYACRRIRKCCSKNHPMPDSDLFTTI